MSGWIAVLLAGTLWCASCSRAVPAESTERLQKPEGQLAVEIARTHPCVAAALVHVLWSKVSEGEGTFYLDDLPSPQAIALMVSHDISDNAVAFPARPNPYSDAYLIEVRWSAKKRADRSLLVSVQAQLVNPAGVRLRPVHVVESPFSVVVSADGRRWVDPGTPVPHAMTADASNLPWRQKAHD